MQGSGGDTLATISLLSYPLALPASSETSFYCVITFLFSFTPLFLSWIPFDRWSRGRLRTSAARTRRVETDEEGEVG